MILLAPHPPWFVLVIQTNVNKASFVINYPIGSTNYIVYLEYYCYYFIRKHYELLRIFRTYLMC